MILICSAISLWQRVANFEKCLKIHSIVVSILLKLVVPRCCSTLMFRATMFASKIAPFNITARDMFDVTGKARVVGHSNSPL